MALLCTKSPLNKHTQWFQVESQFPREGYPGSVVMECPVGGQYSFVGQDDMPTGRTLERL